MKRLLLALLLAFPLFGSQSLQITTGDTVSFTPPETATWQALGAFRVELAVDITTCSSTTTLFKFGSHILNCTSATTLNHQTGTDSGNIDITGKTQLLIRMQRDPGQTLASTNGASPKGMVEVWDVNGTGRVQKITSDTSANLDVSSVQSFSVGTADIEIHWIKVYSTLTEIGRNAPLPDPHEDGDLANWEFEGVLTDSGPDGIDFSTTGTIFTTTPVMNPVADPTVDGDPYWMAQPSVRAGAAVTLSAERSISYDAVSALTCVWSDQTVGGSGPTAILFTGSTTACTTTAVFPTYGEYDLRLVVTDNAANTGTANVTVGAVATDDNRIVVMGDEAFAFTLGENIQWGQSAWPFLPERMYKMAEAFSAGISPAGWETKGAGTVSVTNGSPTVTGSGTNFQATYCSGGTTPDENMFIVTASDGKNWQTIITSCDSATQLTMQNNWNKATESGLQYSFWTTANQILWTNSSENENYYDNVWAYYFLCKTSGFQWACDAANTLAEKWWAMPYIVEGEVGSGPRGGNGVTDPRRMTLIGIMLWAKENGTEATVFPGIEAAIEFYDNLWVTHSLNYCSSDVREAWYVGMWLSLAAELDPNATRAANYQSILTAAMDASAGPSGGDIDPDICRIANGMWPNRLDATKGAGTVSVTNGSPTVTCETTCDWDAADVGSYFQIGILSDRDRASDMGQYLISAQDATTLTLSTNFTGTTGTGRFYWIGENHTYQYQGLSNAMPQWALHWQYKGGLTDERQAVVDTFDAFSTKLWWPEKKGLYNMNDDAGCAVDIAATTANTACQYDPTSSASGKRFLSLEDVAAMTFGVEYGRQIDDANTATRVAFMDEMLGAAMGGLKGPQSDTTWAEEYNDGQTTFVDGFNGKQKNFGFCCGVGGASTWDAERLGGLAAENLVSYSVPLDVAGVTNAVDADVTLYEPKGTVNRVVNDQTGSTAAVTGDARQGPHLAKIEYKDSMDSVLQTDWEMVAAPAEAGAAAVIEGSLSIGGAVSF